ncbi:hypothetical protein KIN20_024689 [Parelaphostrongylus tenuis]|uniref:Uncharacterized protein n=1 Tax=Parelaphostrongylus tenuis TaxID=148309 RepID=A0AAD5N8F5_PARTN|nr:hypothetical protein KIN20_024689 [Parelaphostrongylus tenuis]
MPAPFRSALGVMDALGIEAGQQLHTTRDYGRRFAIASWVPSFIAEVVCSLIERHPEMLQRLTLENN